MHELTHDLEGTRGYDALSKAANELVDQKTKDEIRKRYEDFYKESGKEINDAEIESEITAHYFAEALDNSNFLEKYVNEQRNFFTRIKRWFVKLKERATGQLSKEARVLEKVYDALLRNPIETAKAIKKTSFAILKDAQGREYVEINNDILNGVPQSEWKNVINENLKSRVVIVANSAIKLNNQTREEVRGSKDTQNLLKNDLQKYGDKIRATGNIDEVLQASTSYINEGLNHIRKDNIVAFARGKVLLKILGRGYSADVIVGITKGDNLVLYDVIKFTPEKITARFVKEKNAISLQSPLKDSGESKNLASNNIIRKFSEKSTPDTKKDVKYSLATDSKGRKLTKEQQEFFKDSKVRDGQGRLLEVYRGTGADFTTFDRTKARSYSVTNYDLPAFYFTSDKAQTRDYGKRVIEAYINIKNPLIADDQLPTLREGETPNDLYKRLIKEGYDGIIIPESDEFIAFYPNQIKLTTNLNPTESEDICYSLSPTSEMVQTKRPGPEKVTKRDERSYLEGAFIIDPARSNKLSANFYKMYDQANYGKSDGDETAIYQVRHLNRVREAVNELFKEKKAIENSDLPDRDKRKQI